MKLLEILSNDLYKWDAQYPTMWHGMFKHGHTIGEYRLFSETMKDFFEYDLSPKSHSQFTRTFQNQKLIWMVQITPFGDPQIMVQMMKDFVQDIKPTALALTGSAARLAPMFEQGWQQIPTYAKDKTPLIVLLKGSPLKQ